MGFIGRTGLPNLLKDAQVLSIWEGTTNVLCSDFVRAILKVENRVKPIDSLNKFFLQIFERIA
jgi:putative acyl-CoA dehydrogenase